MNPDEIKRLVDQIHRERSIDKETLYRCIEESLETAARRHGSGNGADDSLYEIRIDRNTGAINATMNGVPIAINSIIASTGTQAVRQSVNQKIREAIRDTAYDRYFGRLTNGQELITGVVRRIERAGISVTIDGNQDAWLPNSNKIRGEMYHVDREYDFVIEKVEKDGVRVKVTLSRTSKLLLQRLFERESPEVSDGTVEIVSSYRLPGERAKIAVRSNDSLVEPIGACVGVRKTRVSNVTNALNGEMIDVVLWSDDTSEFIKNALEPAIVNEVILCPKLDRAIVLVRPEQRSVAIGKKGQNIKLVKHLVRGWEIEIITQDENRDELAEMLNNATERFNQIEGLTPEVVDYLVGEGYMSFYDLSCIEPSDLAKVAGLTPEQTEEVLSKIEKLADQEEELQQQQREQLQQQRQLQKRSQQNEEDRRDD